MIVMTETHLRCHYFLKKSALQPGEDGNEEDHTEPVARTSTGVGISGDDEEVTADDGDE